MAGGGGRAMGRAGVLACVALGSLFGSAEADIKKAGQRGYHLLLHMIQADQGELEQTDKHGAKGFSEKSLNYELDIADYKVESVQIGVTLNGEKYELDFPELWIKRGEEEFEQEEYDVTVPFFFHVNMSTGVEAFEQTILVKLKDPKGDAHKVYTIIVKQPPITDRIHYAKELSIVDESGAHIDLLPKFNSSHRNYKLIVSQDAKFVMINFVCPNHDGVTREFLTPDDEKVTKWPHKFELAEVDSEILQFSCVYVDKKWTKNNKLTRFYIVDLEKDLEDPAELKVDLFVTPPKGWCEVTPTHGNTSWMWADWENASNVNMTHEMIREGMDDAKELYKDGIICRGNPGTWDLVSIPNSTAAVVRLINKDNVEAKLPPFMIQQFHVDEGSHSYFMRVHAGTEKRFYKVLFMTVQHCAALDKDHHIDGKALKRPNPNKPRDSLCLTNPCHETYDANRCFQDAPTCKDGFDNGKIHCQGEKLPRSDPENGRCYAWECGHPGHEDYESDHCCGEVNMVTTTTTPEPTQTLHSPARKIRITIKSTGRQNMINESNILVRTHGFEVDSQVWVPQDVVSRGEPAIEGDGPFIGTIKSCDLQQQRCVIDSSSKTLDIPAQFIRLHYPGFQEGEWVHVARQGNVRTVAEGVIWSSCTEKCRVQFIEDGVKESGEPSVFYDPSVIRRKGTFTRGENVFYHGWPAQTMELCLDSHHCRVQFLNRTEVKATTPDIGVLAPLEAGQDVWYIDHSGADPVPAIIEDYVHRINIDVTFKLSSADTDEAKYDQQVVMTFYDLPGVQADGSIPNKSKVEKYQVSRDGQVYRMDEYPSKLDIGMRVIKDGRSALFAKCDSDDPHVNLPQDCLIFQDDDTIQIGLPPLPTPQIRVPKFMIGDRVQAFNRMSTITDSREGFGTEGFQVTFDDNGDVSGFLHEDDLKPVPFEKDYIQGEKVMFRLHECQIDVWDKDLHAWFLIMSGDPDCPQGPMLPSQLQPVATARTKEVPFLAGDAVIVFGQEGIVKGGPDDANNYIIEFVESKARMSLSPEHFDRREDEFKVGEQVIAGDAEGTIVSNPEWIDGYKVMCDNDVSMLVSKEEIQTDGPIAANAKCRVEGKQCTVVYGPFSLAKYKVDYGNGKTESVRAKDIKYVRDALLEHYTKVGDEVTIASNGRKAIVAHGPNKNGAFTLRYEDTGKLSGPRYETEWSTDAALRVPLPPYEKGQEVRIMQKGHPDYGMKAIVHGWTGDIYTVVPLGDSAGADQITESALQGVARKDEVISDDISDEAWKVLKQPAATGPKPWVVGVVCGTLSMLFLTGLQRSSAPQTQRAPSRLEE